MAALSQLLLQMLLVTATAYPTGGQTALVQIADEARPAPVPASVASALSGSMGKHGAGWSPAASVASGDQNTQKDASTAAGMVEDTEKSGAGGVIAPPVVMANPSGPCAPAPPHAAAEDATVVCGSARTVAGDHSGHAADDRSCVAVVLLRIGRPWGWLSWSWL